MNEHRSVAVVGASTDRAKFGNKAVRAYQRQGWDVYPIHPSAADIEGVPAWRSLNELPSRVDRVVLYLPPTVGVNVLPEIAQAAPHEFYVNPGAESVELIEEARRLGLEPILACSIVAIGESPD